MPGGGPGLAGCAKGPELRSDHGAGAGTTRGSGTANLSGGTAQQLYLAVRFGLVEHFAETAEPLPIVMDDILVNFDPERAQLTARSIERLAESQQVIYFTCHQETPLTSGTQLHLER